MPKDVLHNMYSNMYGEGKNFQTTKPSVTMKKLLTKKENEKEIARHNDKYKKVGKIFGFLYHAEYYQGK